MNRYSIMTPDLKSYFHSTGDDGVARYYDSIAHYVTQPDSTLFGAVLVEMKNQKCGFSLSLNFRSFWRWIPLCEWRHSKQIHWLCINIFYRSNFEPVPAKIVKDHCSAELKSGADE